MSVYTPIERKEALAVLKILREKWGLSSDEAVFVDAHKDDDMWDQGEAGSRAYRRFLNADMREIPTCILERYQDVMDHDVH